MILKPIFIKVTGTSASEDSVKYEDDDAWQVANGVFKCINVGNRYANLLSKEDVLSVYNLEKAGWNNEKNNKATLLYWNGKDNKFMINASSYHSKYDTFCSTPNNADYPNSITLLNVTLTHTSKKLKLIDSAGADVYIDVEDSSDIYPTLTVNKWDSNIDENATGLTYDARKIGLSGSNDRFNKYTMVSTQNIYKNGSNLAYTGRFKLLSVYYKYQIKKNKYFTNLKDTIHGSCYFNKLLKPSNSILEDLNEDNPNIDIKSYRVDASINGYPYPLKKKGLFCTINNVFYCSGNGVIGESEAGHYVIPGDIPDGNVHDITTTYVKYDANNNDLFGLTGTGEGKGCSGFFEVVGLGGSVLKSTKSGDDSYIRVNNQNYTINDAGLSMYYGFEKYSNVTNGTVYETEMEHQIIFGMFMDNSGNGAVKYTILPKQKIKFLYNSINNKQNSGNSNNNCLINTSVYEYYEPSNYNRHYRNKIIDTCTIDLLSIFRQLKLDFAQSNCSTCHRVSNRQISGTNLPAASKIPLLGTRNGILKYTENKAEDDYNVLLFKLGNGNIVHSIFSCNTFNDKNTNYRDYDSATIIDTTNKTVFLQYYESTYGSYRYYYPYPNP